MIRRYLVILILALVACTGAAACGKLLPGGAKPPAAAPPPPPPVPATPPVNLTLEASQTVNPNDSNRPSPVVVRVYQLKDDAAFRAASCGRLYDEDKAALGPDLIERTAATLRPGDRTTVSVVLNKELRFIGVAAFYFECDNAQWKIVIPTPLKGDGTILVDKSSVSFTSK